ncbi:hypothetical protein [Nocardioides ochotonae]|uniref:hypothetical protein n=1 Tax=Nocardioides ochotonae TaxID=2685869 RepID=UPI00140D9066|nr:hypothetical protein [Nocardioides ochotonae]
MGRDEARSEPFNQALDSSLNLETRLWGRSNCHQFVQQTRSATTSERYSVKRSSCLAIVSVFALALTACSSDEEEPAAGACQSGRDTAVEAVSALLQAAVAQDVDLACEVTAKMSDEDLGSNLAEIAAFVQEVGGLDVVSSKELPAGQMGRGHFVEVGVADSLRTVQFMVIDESGRFLVDVPSSDSSTDEPTTAPSPDETNSSGPAGVCDGRCRSSRSSGRAKVLAAPTGGGVGVACWHR